MKTKTILIAAVMFLAFSVAAFAQATFTVGSIPVTTVVASGLTEKTGDVTFSTVYNSPPIITGTITINYGVPITFIGGIFIGAAPVPTTDIQVLSSTNGQLVLGIMQQLAVPYSFRVSGVRVAVANSGLTVLDASISTTNNALTAGETTVRVINSIQPGIASFTVANAVNFNSIFGGGCSTATLNITENFLNAYGVTNVTDTTQSVSTMVRITVSAIPDGLELTFPGTAGTMWTRALSNGDLANSAITLPDGLGTTSVYYRVTSDTSATAIDILSIPVQVCGFVPMDLGSVTATATLAPIGTVAPGPIPRYVEALVPASVPIVSVQPGTSTLLVPYSLYVAESYDTGLAIANTTKDPGPDVLGITYTMVPQQGTCTFNFFEQGSGTQRTYTTQAGSPGAGLNAAGEVPAGSVYTVLLSELLGQLPQKPAEWTGYIFITCDFTNAHGQYFISDFEFFTNGALMLVIDTDSWFRPAVEQLDN